MLAPAAERACTPRRPGRCREGLVHAAWLCGRRDHVAHKALLQASPCVRAQGSYQSPCVTDSSLRAARLAARILLSRSLRCAAREAAACVG